MEGRKRRKVGREGEEEEGVGRRVDGREMGRTWGKKPGVRDDGARKEGGKRGV